MHVCVGGCSTCDECWCGRGTVTINLLVFSQVANETLHTERPDLPECFQLSVLAWLPCIYLWAACPIYLFYLKRNNKGYIMMSIMNRFKTVSELCCFFSFWKFAMKKQRNAFGLYYLLKSKCNLLNQLVTVCFIITFSSTLKYLLIGNDNFNS